MEQPAGQDEGSLAHFFFTFVIINNKDYETVDGTGSSYYLRSGAAPQRNLHKTFSLGIYLFVALLF